MFFQMWKKKRFHSNIIYSIDKTDSLKQNFWLIFAGLQALENVLGKFANPFSAFAHSSGEVLGKKTMRSNFLFSWIHPPAPKRLKISQLWKEV